MVFLTLTTIAMTNQNAPTALNTAPLSESKPAAKQRRATTIKAPPELTNVFIAILR